MRKGRRNKITAVLLSILMGGTSIHTYDIKAAEIEKNVTEKTEEETNLSEQKVTEEAEKEELTENEKTETEEAEPVNGKDAEIEKEAEEELPEEKETEIEEATEEKEAEIEEATEEKETEIEEAAEEKEEKIEEATEEKKEKTEEREQTPRKETKAEKKENSKKPEVPVETETPVDENKAPEGEMKLRSRALPLETDDKAETEQPQEGMANSWRYRNGERILLDDFIRMRAGYQPWSKVNGYYINSRGEKIEGAIAKGIDVSEWQEVIDWNRVKKTDVDYAIIRCGYGMNQKNQDDRYWKRNADECTRLGIPFGTYLYSYADSVERAKSEAEHVLRLVKGYDLKYPIYYDLEENGIRERLSKREIAQIAKTFCDIIAAAGYNVAIYANTDWYTNYLTDPVFNSLNKWVAQYNSVCTYNGKYTMWQCTDAGIVDGISGRVDLNMDFGTVGMPEIVKKGGKYYCYAGSTQLFGTQKVKGAWYYFNPNAGGAAQIGWRNTASHRYYYDADGKLVRGVKKIDAAWYYFNSNGAMQKGWRKTANSRYYYGTDGRLVRGVAKISGAWYYFNSNGAMQKGWRKTANSRYYYGTDGRLVRGVAKISGAWYYFNSNGAMQKGWRKTANSRYYYGTDGRLVRGAAKISGAWYYFNSNGAMLKGWRTTAQDRYYYDTSGKQVRGEKKIGTAWYAFDENNGKMIKNARYKGKYYGADGKRTKAAS